MLIQIRNHLREDIRTEMQQVSDALMSGKAADYADYRRMVGILTGLKKSLDVIDARFRRLDDEGE